MQKPIWIFGGIAGILSASLEYLFYSGQIDNSKFMYLLKVFILLICIVFGLILIKKLIGGVISIARTLLSGILISVVKSLITIAVFLALYAPDGSFYEPHLQKAKTEATEIINEKSDLAEDEKPAKIIEAHSYIDGQFKPLGYSVSTIIEGLVTGFIVSLLMAAFIATNMMYKE